MRRTFLMNLIFLLAINLLIKPFGVVVDFQVQEFAGGEQYGRYWALFNLCLILSFLQDIGVTNFYNRKMAGRPGSIADFYRKGVPVKLMLGLVYGVFVFLVGSLLGYTEDWKLLALLAGNQVVLGWVLYFRAVLAGQGKYKLSSLVSGLDKLVLILICSYWLYQFRQQGAEIFPVERMVISHSVGLLVALIASMIFAGREVLGSRLFFSWRYTRQLLTTSFGYSLIVILMYVYTNTDSIMVERMLDDGARESGYYAAAFRFVDTYNNLAYNFPMLLLPMLSFLIGQRDLEGQKALLTQSFKILFGGTVVLAVTVFLCREELLRLPFPDDDGRVMAASGVLAYLSFNMICLAVMHTCGNYITALGKMKFLNRLAGAGIILNLVLNFILIPSEKAEGAAMASLITQVFICVFQGVMVVRILKFRLPIGLAVRILLALGIGIGGQIYLNGVLTEIGIVTKSLILLLWGGVVLIGSRLIDIKDFIQTMRDSSSK